MTPAHSLIGLVLLESAGDSIGEQTASIINGLATRHEGLKAVEMMTVINTLLPMLAVKSENTPREIMQLLWDALPTDDEWDEEWAPELRNHMERAAAA